jgi:hypothetical protein
MQKSREEFPKHRAPKDVLRISTLLYEEGFLSKTKTALGTSIIEWARGLDPGGTAYQYDLTITGDQWLHLPGGSFCILSCPDGWCLYGLLCNHFRTRGDVTGPFADYSLILYAFCATGWSM